MRRILWAGGLCMAIPLILGLTAPVVLRAAKNPDRTEAINNFRQLHLALVDFNADYGCFPDASTIADVQSKTHTTLALGTSTSNEYFRQLIAADTAKSEKVFWAKTPATPRKPNDILGADTLKKGECSFAYVTGLSAADNPATPVAMTPMIAGTVQFDPTVFGEKALILRIDGSVRPETIRLDTREVPLAGGKTLFDPSAPLWDGKTPGLKWPE